MASIREIARPTDLEGAFDLLNDEKRNTRILAGGTDLLLKYPDADGPDLTIVDITGIASLDTIAAQADGLRIGATATLTDVIRSGVVAERFPVLVEGAVVVAGPQIRNMATLAGNICNASPSADTVTPLLVLDAAVGIVSGTGSRRVPLHEFFVGPGRTVLESGELVEAIWIPWPGPSARASYTKVSPRKAMDLAVVGVAVSVWRDGSGIRSRIGLGAVAPTPLRATAAEAVVEGAAEITADLAAEAGRVAAAGVAPISDVRGSAGYRTKMVERVVARLLLELGADLNDGEVV